MSIEIDSQLVAELESDPVFQEISGRVSYKDDRFFRQAWGIHERKKWYPILIRDQKTDDIGFEYNPGGWKSKEKAGKQKIPLPALLSIIIHESYDLKDTIRCKYDDPSSSQDGRLVSDLQFDTELKSLILRFQSKNKEPLKKVQRQKKNAVFSAEEMSMVFKSAQEVDGCVNGFEGEERDAIAKYRVNQGRFRKILLRHWGSTCCVSGLNDERLLIASHILPWSMSTANQKGDPFNGLLLSVTWDALFDKGLISFDNDGKAILDKLSSEVVDCLGLDTSHFMINPEKLTSEHKQYLFSSIRLKPSPFRRTDLSQMLYLRYGLSLWQSYSL